MDSLLVALSIIACLQLRADVGLPSFLKKADLLQGFDLSWRDGCLFQLAQAGVEGRSWLLQDSLFSRDQFRVKLSNFLGPLRQAEFGVGQGKATSVHLFGTLTRGLGDLYRPTPGVGLGFTKAEAGSILHPALLSRAPAEPVCSLAYPQKLAKQSLQGTNLIQWTCSLPAKGWWPWRLLRHTGLACSNTWMTPCPLTPPLLGIGTVPCSRMSMLVLHGGVV